VDSVIGFVELTQGNFDLMNPPTFTGAGQKFRIRLQLGQLSNEIVLSFEEPWFLQKQLALGFSLFRTSSNYVSTYYNEVDLGGTVYVRKHLFELIDAQLASMTASIRRWLAAIAARNRTMFSFIAVQRQAIRSSTRSCSARFGEHNRVLRIDTSLTHFSNWSPNLTFNSV